MHSDVCRPLETAMPTCTSEAARKLSALWVHSTVATARRPVKAVRVPCRCSDTTVSASVHTTMNSSATTNQ